MAKTTKGKKKAAEVKLAKSKKKFLDATQKEVEFYCSYDFSVGEIASRLGLTFGQAMDRVKQVNEELGEFVGSFGLDYVNTQRARLIMRSNIRQDRLLNHVKTVEGIIEKQAESGHVTIMYPDKTVANLRDEDKWLNQLLRDVEKAYGGGGGKKPPEDMSKYVGKLMQDVHGDEDEDEEEVDQDEEDHDVPEDLIEDLKTAVKDEAT